MLQGIKVQAGPRSIAVSVATSVATSISISI